MKDQAPEFRLIDKSRTKGTLFPGYTVARVKKFTPGKRINIRKSDEVEPSEINSLEARQAAIKKETVALTSMFLPEVWQKIHEWINKHPPGLASFLPSTYGLVFEPIDEVKGKTEHADSRKVVDILNMHTSLVFQEFIRSWQLEQEEKLSQPNPALEERRKKAYERYKKILELGISGVNNKRSGKGITSIEEHFIGGFNTARFMIWRLFKILPEVYEKQYGKPPGKTELVKLVRGIRPLVLVIAQSDRPTLSSIELELSEPTADESIIPQQADFNPKNFLILKQGENFYLEIKSEVLDETETLIRRLGNDPLRTGCPALLAEGAKGKNVVSEMYDWFAKLYEEFYINNLAESK